MVAERSGLRITPFEAPGVRRTISVAHRADVGLSRAARELRRVLFAHLRETQGAPEAVRDAPVARLLLPPPGEED
jgi:hypothetical protein